MTTGRVVATGPGVVSETAAGLPQPITFTDVFAGIGGFHQALTQVGAVLAWACECDADAAETYRRNFGYDPTGDVTTVSATDVPDHDILCAGFPCQSFSVDGERRGMADPRGRLFYEIVRLLTAKRPRAFILENVPHLLRIDGGRTFAAMRGHLTGFGYSVRHAVLDARHFGLPQRRERLFIVGILGSYRKAALPSFAFPKPGKPAKNLHDLLERNVPARYYFTPEKRDRLIHLREHHRVKRSNRCFKFVHATHANTLTSTHRGVEKNVVVELDGKWRRLTPREYAKLQGFPETFKLHDVDSKAYRQLGNSVAVPVVRAVAERVIEALQFNGGGRGSRRPQG